MVYREINAFDKQPVEPGQVTWGQNQHPGFDRGWGKNPMVYHRKMVI